SDAQWADSEIQFKSRKFDTIVFNFERYKLSCSAPPATLVRTTPIIWINVFAWPSYLKDQKWRVPYAKAVAEIGDYYPPANAKHCYNEPSALGVLDQARSNAERYMNQL